MSAATILHDRGVIARYRAFLPCIGPQTPVISLNEGSTPLIHSPKLSALLGRGAQVYLKYEGLNPTCSFKDRGMTVAVSKAAEAGAQAVVCASTGNTSAAAAAYAARARLGSIVLLPAGKIALGKLVQAFAYGSKVIAIEGNFDDALRLVRELGEDRTSGIAVVNSINPFRLEGQKTASFEIIEELGEAPDVHFLPVGNAGNITAYWQGYREWHALGKAGRLPRMAGVQAAGAAPIFHDRLVEAPETVATAIRIGNPASWDGARAALRESGGHIDAATDAEILHAQAWLAREEGIFAEPASAASVAGLLRAHAGASTAFPLASLPEGASIVCVLTGHGLKDPEIAKAGLPEIRTVRAEKAEILRAMGA
ncbi:MAG: threonine synthase [Verrucomicrobia bacterium]|nr:threonine synthase [Verrucomicrobiota bacterium]